ncbi:ATP-dependent helicase (fragment) [Bartonella henselae]
MIEANVTNMLKEQHNYRIVGNKFFTSLALRKKMIMNSEIVQENDILQDDILIEKHGRGKFEGFRFYANKNTTDNQATTTQIVAENENLTLAFSKRAARFCASGNGDFTLSSNGIVRWIGQPVGQLAATDDFLKPKPIILADTQLTGEARDNVVKRLERFVTFHFETALKPLFDLRGAEGLTDSTSNLASQLVNSLGVIPRREIATVVKNLDQESRAILRRLGVRFGAFHIYVAGMFKPAPVQAITLLWNLQNEGCDQTGLDEIFAALSAGRTSLVVDPRYNRQFYQLAGYRILGQRAVRIDILERLANLIRPALYWKQGNEPKPDGAYDGKSFFVTPTMMSILGANGTDMEEILKGLGYQSHAISSAFFEQNYLQNKTSAHTCTTVQDVPAAECVGEQWQIMDISPKQEEKEALPTCITQSDTGDCLPAAEPVGNFATKQKRVLEEEKVVLLWRYNHHHPHKNNERSGHRGQNKKSKPFKKEVNAQENNSREATSHTRHSHKSNKQHSKRSNHQSSQREKRPNPDSPFAKLAALRDQLIREKDKDAHTLSSKSH